MKSRTSCSPQVLEQALEAAEASVERSPDLLPLLREHGVVDAGGYGVTLLIAGLIAGLRGEASLHEVPHHIAPQLLHDADHESSRYRYCTNFVVNGDGLDGLSFVSRLEELGDSVLVVGDEAHVASPRPHRRTRERDGAFRLLGKVERLDLADMHEQESQRTARLLVNGGGGSATELARCGDRRRRGRRGNAKAVRAIRRLRRRGRLDAQPEHVRDPGRDPRGAREPGDRAARTART